MVVGATITHRRSLGAGAFSMIELVLVIAIVAILAAITAPRYAKAGARYRIDAAAKRVVRDLAMARQRARLRGATQTVTFSESTNSYQIAGIAALNDSTKTYTVTLSDNLYQTTLVEADFGGSTSVSFDGYGVPSSGGTISLQIGDYSKTVVLNAETGRAEVQ